jgi:2-polyprenyl-3-methyl-5-hydroxy-6-metoxy-1,4-benzoquinol methylase
MRTRPKPLSRSPARSILSRVGDCCDPQGSSGYDAVFDSRFARRTARRYRKRGLTPSAADLIGFAADQGIEEATVLEIGGGIGHLQVELLRRGAAHVTNLEISGNYEHEASALLERTGMSDRVTRRLIDIAESPDDVEPADVVILHRVVCCYPDYERLLTAAASHAKRVLAFTHPPANVIARTAIGSENLLRRLRGNPVRAFVHPPDDMIRVLQAHGLTPRLQERRRGWQVVGLVRA